MKVKDLIKHLQDQLDDKEIVIISANGDECEVDSIDSDDKTVGLQISVDYFGWL